MKILLCENNLAGFLTAVYHAYYTHKDTSLITQHASRVSMLDQGIVILTDLSLASKVRKGIIKKVGQEGYRDIICAYLSCDTGKEIVIFDYLRLLFKVGKKVFSMYSDDRVIAFNDILKKVNHESHRLQGFIRFQEMANGIFYSGFSADNDVLELIIPHFTARFNCQKFVLHDIKRSKMAYYDGKNCHLLVSPPNFSILISEGEVRFDRLWKQYHKNIAIDERKNTTCQKRFLPLKYRWFMNEF